MKRSFQDHIGNVGASGEQVQSTSDSLQNLKISNATQPKLEEEGTKASYTPSTGPAVWKILPIAETNILSYRPLPTTASLPDWFALDAIDARERLAFGPFLSTSEDERAYKELRNWMVSEFRALQCSQNLKLTLSHCFQSLRHAVKPDARFVVNLFNNLEMWKLINARTTPVTLPAYPPKFTGDAALLSDESAIFDYNANNHFSLLVKKQEGVAFYHCLACRTLIRGPRFQSLKHDASMCAACFALGLFPKDAYSSDFVRLDGYDFGKTASPDSRDHWSLAETARLLDGISKSLENWDDIAVYVGNKTPEECVKHFLQLPSEAAVDPVLGLFSSSSNQIMTVVAFMLQAVSPQVAATFARAFLTAFHKHFEDNKLDLVNGQAKPKIPIELVERAMNAARGKASELAAQEMDELQRIVYDVVATQIEKIELKTKQLKVLEQYLEEEDNKAIQLQPDYFESPL